MLFHCSKQQKTRAPSSSLSLHTIFLFLTSLLLLFTNTHSLQMSNTYNLPLDSLATTANSYASAHGIQVEKKHPKKGESEEATSYFECAPISLLPNAYPKAAFIRAQKVATSFNLLVDRIARNSHFLQSTLGGEVSAADPFTAKLLELYNEIYVNPTTASATAKQAHCLGIFRSDYMLHSFEDPDNNNEMVVDIKQVELNTIASSFAGLSTKVADLHRYLVARHGDCEEMTSFLKANKDAIYKDASAASTASDKDILPDGVPVNPALERLAWAMYMTTKRYEECFDSKKKKQLAVLFVVQEGESNTVDQRLLEFQLFADYQVPVLRYSLQRLYEIAVVDDESTTSGALTVDGYEIALVYYRAGYAPTDYPSGDDTTSEASGTGKEWKARVRMECSRATKCPSLGYHLAGTKKVQQALARPGVLEQFFPDDKKDDGSIAAMRRVFAGLYSLSDGGGETDDMVDADYDAVRDVLTSETGPDRYVLKPQREGGGYNFYGQQLLAKLRDHVQMNSDDDKDNKMVLDAALGEYILMQRLFPPEQEAILSRSGKVEGMGPSISELGCFGTILCGPPKDGGDDKPSVVLHNEYAGFLLRTKFSGVDEGGVASGFATLSSPYLC